jgi:hypothetical protein
MYINLLAQTVSNSSELRSRDLTKIDVNQYSDYDSLQSTQCSSCEVQDDHSAYWTPQLYYAHSNGTIQEVRNEGMTVYYVG